MALRDRMTRVFNAFRSDDNFEEPPLVPGGGSVSYGGSSPSRSRLKYQNDKSILTSVLTRISVDVAKMELRHVKLDPETNRYSSDINSGLNRAMNLEANLDQGPRMFRQDIAMTLLDKGVIAIVAVDTTRDAQTGQITDVHTLRVGEIVTWYPKHVRVSLYNENRGQRQEVLLEKQYVAVVENPFYAVMNEPNATLQRLIRKLNLLDAVDEQSSSGKLDLIIQLPYQVKSDTKREHADKRRQDLESQMKDSKYGVAWTDATEKIVQLNRPLENNLLKQVEWLLETLYGQLGITPAIMNGTADEAAMLYYYDRTIEPIVDSVRESIRRAFIGHKANENILYFRNPFALVTMDKMAEIADKFSRNEIFSPNEIRGFMGVPPDSDPKSDELKNSNMPPYPAASPSDGQLAQDPKEGQNGA